MSQERSAASKTASKKSAATPANSKPAEAKPATRKRAVKSSTAELPGAMQSAWSDMDRHNMIATAAYYRAEKRGFDGGCAMDDWLIAEAEVDAMLYH